MKSGSGDQFDANNQGDSEEEEEEDSDEEEGEEEEAIVAVEGTENIMLVEYLERKREGEGEGEREGEVGEGLLCTKYLMKDLGSVRREMKEEDNTNTIPLTTASNTNSKGIINKDPLASLDLDLDLATFGTRASTPSQIGRNKDNNQKKQKQPKNSNQVYQDSGFVESRGLLRTPDDSFAYMNHGNNANSNKNDQGGNESGRVDDDDDDHLPLSQRDDADEGGGGEAQRVEAFGQKERLVRTPTQSERRQLKQRDNNAR
jgi:hypothetical protein